MKFEFDDINFKEQADLMNLLNKYEINEQIQNKKSFGFNEDTIYNFIDENKN